MLQPGEAVGGSPMKEIFDKAADYTVFAGNGVSLLEDYQWDLVSIPEEPAMADMLEANRRGIRFAYARQCSMLLTPMSEDGLWDAACSYLAAGGRLCKMPIGNGDYRLFAVVDYRKAI